MRPPTSSHIDLLCFKIAYFGHNESQNMPKRAANAALESVATMPRRHPQETS